MPHHKSCVKRIATSEKARKRNRQMKSRIHNAIKDLQNAKDKDTAEAKLKSVYSVLDKGVKCGVIHKNKAANQKAVLSTATTK